MDAQSSVDEREELLSQITSHVPSLHREHGIRSPLGGDILRTVNDREDDFMSQITSHTPSVHRVGRNRVSLSGDTLQPPVDYEDRLLKSIRNHPLYRRNNSLYRVHGDQSTLGGNFLNSVNNRDQVLSRASSFYETHRERTSSGGGILHPVDHLEKLLSQTTSHAPSIHRGNGFRTDFGNDSLRSFDNRDDWLSQITSHPPSLHRVHTNRASLGDYILPPVDYEEEQLSQISNHVPSFHRVNENRASFGGDIFQPVENEEEMLSELSDYAHRFHQGHISSPGTGDGVIRSLTARPADFHEEREINREFLDHEYSISSPYNPLRTPSRPDLAVNGDYSSSISSRESGVHESSLHRNPLGPPRRRLRRQITVSNSGGSSSPIILTYNSKLSDRNVTFDMSYFGGDRRDDAMLRNASLNIAPRRRLQIEQLFDGLWTPPRRRDRIRKAGSIGVVAQKYEHRPYTFGGVFVPTRPGHLIEGKLLND